MRVCMCVAHTRTLLFFLITSTGGKHRVKRLRASRPVVVMILTNGEQMGNKWHGVGRPFPPQGVGVQIPKWGIFKTTPPTVRVQCQNFKFFGKREKRPYKWLQCGFCLANTVVIHTQNCIFGRPKGTKTALQVVTTRFLRCVVIATNP